MLQTTIKGYKITIFKSYNGTQLFINDSNGNQVYAHRVMGCPVSRAREVINKL
jgi:hypothetical protein